MVMWEMETSTPSSSTRRMHRRRRLRRSKRLPNNLASKYYRRLISIENLIKSKIPIFPTKEGNFSTVSFFFRKSGFLLRIFCRPSLSSNPFETNSKKNKSCSNMQILFASFRMFVRECEREREFCFSSLICYSRLFMTPR